MMESMRRHRGYSGLWIHAVRGASSGLAVVWLLLTGLAHAAPPLDANGLAGYAEFRQAPAHRAFAIAPGGAWAWRGDMPSPELAMQAALDDCRGLARRTCLPYAQDAKVVFNPQDWAQAWRPYATSAQARRASVGIKPGQRFPDLAWRDQHGKAQTLSAQRGRVVLLHFWGSWCPPCQREMPDLHKLYDRLKPASDIRMVFLPVREPAARSRAWLRERRIAVPVADAGGAAEHKGVFMLGDGGRIADRDLARAFPTSYVIDRNGIVLFAQVGPVHDWLALEPLLRDAARANVQ
jgi:thiol-disulfide isomerase/thioredoxin